MCVRNNMVLPVWECPQFAEMIEGGWVMKLTKERIAWLREKLNTVIIVSLMCGECMEGVDIQQDLEDALDDIAQLEARIKELEAELDSEKRWAEQYARERDQTKAERDAFREKYNELIYAVGIKHPIGLKDG